MWTKLRLKNFRLFKDTGDIELAPLTFFIGPNSSGKSSLVKSFLLLRQSLFESRPYEQITLKPSNPENGEDFGTWADLIYCNDQSLPLGIEVEFVNTSKQTSKPNNPAKPVQFSIIWEKSRIRKVEYRSEGKTVIGVKKTRDVFLPFSNKDKYLGKPHEEWKPNKFHEIYETSQTLNGNMPKGQNEMTDVQFWFYDMLEWTLFMGARPEPKLLYSLPSDPPHDAGVHGQYAVDFLIDKPVRRDLSRWLPKLGLGSDLSVEADGNNWTIKMTSPCGSNNHLAHMGSGTAKVLPVLTQGLVMMSNSTFVIEHPEIELNPRIQAALGDFFASVYLKDQTKQFIIETHSEQLLSRIRTWIAKGKLSPDQVVMYYCDFDQKPLKLEINKFGQFINFPSGFFMEEITEALDQTKAAFKNARKTK